MLQAILPRSCNTFCVPTLYHVFAKRSRCDWLHSAHHGPCFQFEAKNSTVVVHFHHKSIPVDEMHNHCAIFAPDGSVRLIAGTFRPEQK